MFVIAISSRWAESFIVINCPSLSLVTEFCFNVSLHNISIDPLAFLSLLFAWWIFIHPFIFNLFLSLNLNCLLKTAYSQIFFFNPVWHLCLLIELFKRFTFNLLLIQLDLHLPFYFVFSICLMSFLFLYSSFMAFFCFRCIFSGLTFFFL